MHSDVGEESGNIALWLCSLPHVKSCCVGLRKFRVSNSLAFEHLQRGKSFSISYVRQSLKISDFFK